MKLLIAILSSTLIACSVTTATPVNPSRTTNFESSSTAIYTATATTYPSTSTFLDLNGEKRQSKNTQKQNVASKHLPVFHPQHTASSTLRRVASTLQRASSSMRRVSSTLRRAASSVQKVASSLTWKVDRS
ncbi:hypothetical protein QVD99_005603 [Batrachochytrium dendrobatidis]|nr:hypothetical protein QVD99_005603 [Batrachochytrium dendrobatidis]